MERIPVEGGPHVRERLDTWTEPWAVRLTSDYIKRLLIERHHIRAALEHTGGSIVLRGTAASVEQPISYSSVVGNDLHLDLLEAEKVLTENLSKQDLAAILMWADGFNQRQAAEYHHIKSGAIRMRVHRAMRKVAEKANEGEDAGREG